MTTLTLLRDHTGLLRIDCNLYEKKKIPGYKKCTSFRKQRKRKINLTEDYGMGTTLRLTYIANHQIWDSGRCGLSGLLLTGGGTLLTDGAGVLGDGGGSLETDGAGGLGDGGGSLETDLLLCLTGNGGGSSSSVSCELGSDNCSGLLISDLLDVLTGRGGGEGEWSFAPKVSPFISSEQSSVVGRCGCTGPCCVRNREIEKPFYLNFSVEFVPEAIKKNF